jgi:hypothetical protein
MAMAGLSVAGLSVAVAVFVLVSIVISDDGRPEGDPLSFIKLTSSEPPQVALHD